MQTSDRRTNILGIIKNEKLRRKKLKEQRKQILENTKTSYDVIAKILNSIDMSSEADKIQQMDKIL